MRCRRQLSIARAGAAIGGAGCSAAPLGLGHKQKRKKFLTTAAAAMTMRPRTGMEGLTLLGACVANDRGVVNRGSRRASKGPHTLTHAGTRILDSGPAPPSLTATLTRAVFMVKAILVRVGAEEQKGATERAWRWVRSWRGEQGAYERPPAGKGVALCTGARTAG